MRHDDNTTQRWRVTHKRAERQAAGASATALAAEEVERNVRGGATRALHGVNGDKEGNAVWCGARHTIGGRGFVFFTLYNFISDSVCELLVGLDVVVS